MRAIEAPAIYCEGSVTIQIITCTPDQVQTHITALADLLCDGINGGASMSFVAPLSHDEAVAYWRTSVDGVAEGKMFLLVALLDRNVAGCVQLVPAWQPNAPHRAEVTKLLVHSGYRRRGIATQLMQALEVVALREGRWLLFLDTETGSGAEPFYERMGYERMGVMPQHSVNFHGEYAATTFFYKLLRDNVEDAERDI